MARPHKVGDKVHLRKGSPSFKHFDGYMPTSGTIVDRNITHMVGHFCRPYRVEFTDGRTSWYAGREIVRDK